jgi:hypothetical protein
MVSKAMLRSLDFTMISINSFPAGWYKDHIHDFENVFWISVQKRDKRGAGHQRD